MHIITRSRAYTTSSLSKSWHSAAAEFAAQNGSAASGDASVSEKLMRPHANSMGAAKATMLRQHTIASV